MSDPTVHKAASAGEPHVAGSGCCGPTRAAGAAVRETIQRAEPGSTEGLVLLPGGSFRMGTDEPTFPEDGEGPVREVTLEPFWVDPYAVTNAQFADFVRETGYTTEAETFGWSFVFYQFLAVSAAPTQGVQAAPWWRQVYGAKWDKPEGLGSGLEARMDHPVVHVSWNDAVAYANWTGKRLPTEAEWEYAARGGLEGKRFPWGDRLLEGKKHRCNTWQGTFPTSNTKKDGFVGTAPVTSFEPNGYGLYNMTGNTWEWCADWFAVEHTLEPSSDPHGPERGETKVTKGGSYLCHASYCNRYRVAARTHITPDSTTGHTGFRLVRDV